MATPSQSTGGKQRLDKELVLRRLVPTRSQAESYIRLGHVEVNGTKVIKPGELVSASDAIVMTASDRYVSRAGLKLASVASALQLQFRDKVVLDVGSSTGGFTDYALQHGAKLVIAVDVGTDQLHPSLHGHPRIELHEQTDIRSLQSSTLTARPDIVVIDVSFVSLRDILPHVRTLCAKQTLVVAMVKPQFEAGKQQVNKGVIKNDRIRRDILKDFETWALHSWVIVRKSDSEVAGSKGNLERFYALRSSLNHL